MPKYWLVSVPSEGDRDKTWDVMKNAIQPHTERATPFVIPEFKIGNLDSVYLLSEDLVKIDVGFEGVLVKIVDIMKGLLQGDTEQLRSNLSVEEKPVDQYLKSFQWNTMKYRTDKTLKEICDGISQEVNSIDSVTKSKLNAYSALKGTLQSLERKQTGNLSTKSLAGIVKKHHLILDSEYMTTIIVAVPKNSYESWFNSYETITQMVVPRSSTKIEEDNDFGLFNVHVFQKFKDEFILKAREKKFTVRDFVFDERQLDAEKKEYAEVGASTKESWSSLLRLCKTNFGEVFASWMHIKALRVFVESVLRYGLPPDFVCAVIKPKPGSEKKGRDTLNILYSKLGKGAQMSKKDLDENQDEIQGILGDKEYSPFVFFELKWQMDGK